nr:M14 family zinc carboxypeptidase [uncultured Cohaesibacter sp.]
MMNSQSKSVIYRRELSTSLSALTDRFKRSQYHGATVEAWVFDGQKRRKAAERELARAGVKAHIRSAFKPLLHAFLEEIDLTHIESLVVHYPVVFGTPEARFLMEAYPLQDLLAGCECRFEPMPLQDGVPFYRVDMTMSSSRKESVVIFAPNRERQDHVGQAVLSNCGWLRVCGAQDEALDCDEAFETDLEQAFHSIIGFFKDYSWEDKSPLFERLEMRVEAPFHEMALPLAGEAISTAELMHEELYFAALETLKILNGFKEDDRTFAPGQLVPCLAPRGDEIILVELALASDPCLAIDCASESMPMLHSRVEGWRLKEGDAPLKSLAHVDHWLSPETIRESLKVVGGETLISCSRRGRPVWGRYRKGDGPGVVISSGQHANETSGPVGALRAAAKLREDKKNNFAIVPLINPDGFALMRELCKDYPGHMNHAARFTAGGNDLEYVERGYENDILHEIKALADAKLHVNLHGYPSHEFVRPFSGYVPRGQELWTLPKGFMLILRYHPGWERVGEAILQTMISVLQEYEPIMSLNRAQLARFRHYSGAEPGFDVRKDVAHFRQEAPEALFPVTIITEAPDETVYGEDFKILHEAQMRCAIAGARVLRDLI